MSAAAQQIVRRAQLYGMFTSYYFASIACLVINRRKCDNVLSVYLVPDACETRTRTNPNAIELYHNALPSMISITSDMS